MNETPMSLDKRTEIGSTRFCIAVGCLMEQDGPTRVTLGPEREVNPGGPPAFDQVIETPNRTVLCGRGSGKSSLKNPYQPRVRAYGSGKITRRNLTSW